MKNTTIALFLLALVGNAVAADCATTTEKAKTEEEIKKELETKVEGSETQK
jgi:hypothetical protein